MNPSSFGGKRRTWWWLSGFIVVALAVLLLVRPPGEAGSSRAASGDLLPIGPIGTLPGITWADDIHPIFVRNRCGDCHTRGREARVEGLEQFSLGLLDPDDPHNPFYSYHELVYAEGPPTRMEGESLRDGRCCWPREAPDEERRRIWPGHPERSVVLRKIERDYYGWNRPPRFLEEGLRLRWGLPMPWGHPGGNATTGSHHEGSDDAKAPSGEGHERPEKGHTGGYEDYPVRSWPGRVLLRAGLWLGLGEEQLVGLPPPISPDDRMLLRLWITDTFETSDDRTGLVLRVVDDRGRPAVGVPVELVGNYTSPVRRRVEDRFPLTTDGEGRVRLVFAPNSVVTRTWYARVVGSGGPYRQLRLVAGVRVPVDLTAGPVVEPPAETPSADVTDVVNDNRPHRDRGEHR